LLEEATTIEPDNEVAIDHCQTQEMPAFATVDVQRDSLGVVMDRSFVVTEDWLSNLSHLFLSLMLVLFAPT
jgi:hypothetical protein